MEIRDLAQPLSTPLPVKNDGDLKNTSPPPRQPRFGIITALPVEYVAVEALLENPTHVNKPGRGAGRQYLIGEIPSANGGIHQVVLCLLTNMGNNSAAARAALLLEHFPEVESILMVGIAGGVPYPEKPDAHVRLGDIVVSDIGGVVQYDNVKMTSTNLEYRYAPRPPDAVLLEAVRHLNVAQIKGETPWLASIAQVCKKFKMKRPPPQSDILQENGQTIIHPDDPMRKKRLPRVFQGRIASANTLLKDYVKRNDLRDKFGVRAIEMEGSGIADATWNGSAGFMIVRGISDYANESKNDLWHEYAAIVAAAYAKSLIKTVPSTTIDTDQPSHDFEVSPLSQLRPASFIDYIPPVPHSPQPAEDATALLRVCPSGLPASILGRAIGCTPKELETVLRDAIAAQHIVVDGTQWRMKVTEQSVDYSGDVNTLSSVLEELLMYVEYNHRSKLSQDQVATVIELAKRCKDKNPELASTIFFFLNSHLKRLGNKNIIWEMARLALDAAHQTKGVKSIQTVQGEAVALVCGLCWVLQREGQIPLARGYAEQSLELGQSLPWPRNDAFCKKCLGRIYRLQAMETKDKEARQKLFGMSVASLQEAIQCFSSLADADREDEIGDCYSLLGRTYHEAKDYNKAKEAIWEAQKRLTDTGNKDYLDFQILLGDFYAAENDWNAAEEFYNTVIQQKFEYDFEKSDMRARALLQRAKLRWRKKEKGLALQDVQDAEAMWIELNDPRGIANTQWARHVIEEDASKEIINALRLEAPLIRTAALKTYIEQLAGSPTEVVARRAKPTTQEIERLVREAKQRVAREVPLRS